MSAPAEPPPDDAGDVGPAVRAALVLAVLFVAGALGLYGVRAAVSVLVGAAIGILNLLAMRLILREILRPPPPAPPADTEPDDARAKRPNEAAPGPTNADHAEAGRRGGSAWAVFAVLKMFLLFGGVWFLLTRGLVDPMPLVVGYGVLPLGIAASAVWSSLRS